MKRLEFVLLVARYEIVKGFRRTTLGIFWQLPSHTLFILGICAISSAVFGQSFSSRLSFSSAGYLGFLLMAGPVLNSTQYQFRFPVLETSGLPIHLKSVVGLVLHFIDFLVATLILLPLGVGFQLFSEPSRAARVAFVAVISLPLMYGVGSLLALCNLRFRDTEPLVQIVGRLWFLSMPVFWDESLLQPNSVQERILVKWNPFGAVVVHVRAAALGLDFHWESLSMVVLSGVFATMLSLSIHSAAKGSARSLLTLRRT